MKFIFTFLMVLTIVSFVSAQYQPQYYQSESGIKIFQPDVMGKSIALNQQTGDVDIISSLDFTVFPGFPVSQTGSTMEGSIFCNMDADPDFEIVICIGQSIYALNMDGSLVTGWPQSISQAPSGAPAFGDIDGDGEGEIVIGSYYGSSAGSVYAYEKNGSLVTGFPVNSGYVTRSATLADLDNNGSMEIIVNKRTYPTGQVAIYKGDGTLFPGWPQDISSVPAASAAVGDITGDNNPEIIFEAYNALYVWDSGGNLLSGFPYNLPTDVVTSYSSPILVDLDNDNLKEIVFGIHESGGALNGGIYILKNDGTLFPGWPKTTTYWVYAPPSIGDIDGDAQLDIAVGDQVLSGTPVDNVYAWDKNGNLLSGFPVTAQNAINAQIILTDIDNDNLAELIYDDNTASVSNEGYYHALNHDGTPVTGWPLVTDGTTFFQTPCLTDINNDGIMDMVGGGTVGIGSGATTNIYLWNSQLPYVGTKIIIPMFQYNTMHDGVFDNPTLVPVELTSFTAEVRSYNVLLNWTTATEINNQGFEIEKSFDGNFLVVGFVPGMGTTSEPQSYSFVDKNLTPGDYSYRLKQVDFNGSYEYSNIIEVSVNSLYNYSLSQNYPNPFNPTTSINFSIPQAEFVTLKVYDLFGQEVKTLVNERKQEGKYSVKFDGSDLSSGVYVYKITAGNFLDSKKFLLLK
jgi:Secretion system C-terminal sorting domain/FG-GAP-like repeat